MSLLQPDFYIKRDGDTYIYVIESIQLSTSQEDGDFLTIKGRSVESMLTRRILYNHRNENLSQPYTIGGFNVEYPTDTCKTVEDCIRHALEMTIAPTDLNPYGVKWAWDGNFILGKHQGFSELMPPHIDVPNNVTSINNQYITDTRADTNLCGWVTGLVNQVDTKTLFNQWQSAYQIFYNDFTSWFNNLADTLGIATYNQKYEVNAISTEGQGSFKPNIEEYNSTDGDILEVYINGFRLIKDTDYTISGNGSNLNISFKNSLNADNSISVIVVKSELGVYPANAT